MSDVVLKFSINKSILETLLSPFLYRRFFWIWLCMKAPMGFFGNVSMKAYCCGDEKIFYWQSGPVKNLKCKCGQRYLVKWEYNDEVMKDGK